MLGLKLVTFPGCCRDCKNLGGVGKAGPTQVGTDGRSQGEGRKQVRVNGVPWWEPVGGVNTSCGSC